MPKTLNINGKPMTLHVGNLPSHKQDMALTGTVDGLFGIKREIMMIASLGTTTAEGKPLGMYQGYLDNRTKYYPEFRKALEENDLITPVLDSNGRPATKHLGSGDFPLVAFNREKLHEFDPDGCDKYERTSKRTRLSDYTKARVDAMVDAIYDDNKYGNSDGMGF